MQARLHRLERERCVSSVRRSNDDQVEIGGMVPQLCRRLEQANSRISSPGARLSFGIACHDGRKAQPVSRIDQRRVKY